MSAINVDMYGVRNIIENVIQSFKCFLYCGNVMFIPFPSDTTLIDLSEPIGLTCFHLYFPIISNCISNI